MGAAALLSGCLWLPDFPIADKIEPDTNPDDDDGDNIGFCQPRPNSREPVVVGGSVEVREIKCRIRSDHVAVWTLKGVDGTDDEDIDLTIASGVDSVFLHRESLPWSPRPYELVLELRADRVDGGGSDEFWPLIVLPHGDDLVGDPIPLLDTPGGPPPIGGDSP